MIKSIAKAWFAYRYRRYWRRWHGDPRGPFQPSPFFSEEDAYPIAKAIRDEEFPHAPENAGKIEKDTAKK